MEYLSNWYIQYFSQIFICLRCYSHSFVFLELHFGYKANASVTKDSVVFPTRWMCAYKMWHSMKLQHYQWISDSQYCNDLQTFFITSDLISLLKSIKDSWIQSLLISLYLVCFFFSIKLKYRSPWFVFIP